MRKVISVVVGIVRASSGKILISKRRARVVEGGLWEFPGGKIEDGESPLEALGRELREEVGLTPLVAVPTFNSSFRHEYYDLEISAYEVLKWAGEVFPMEGQDLRWVDDLNLGIYDMPEPNKPIKIAAMLPRCSLITPVFVGAEKSYLNKLEQCLIGGVRLIQFRPQVSDMALLIKLARKVRNLCENFGAIVMLNSAVGHPPELIKYFDGIHFSSKELLKFTKRPLASNILVSTSCHNLDELIRAKKMGMDFAYLCPVLPPISHSSPDHLGWELAAELVKQAQLPLYGLGGMEASSASIACGIGLHGISMVSGLWNAEDHRYIVDEVRRGLLAFQV